MRIAAWFAGWSAASAASVPLAQVIDVPGDHATIQEAVDAAPVDGVVVVHGGVWESYVTIRQPLTLIGDPVAILERGIILDGPGSGRVTLSALQLGKWPLEGWECCNGPGIFGGGFDALFVHDSEVFARGWNTFTGLGMGASAVSTTVPFLYFERSSAFGSGAGIDDACTSAPAGWIPGAAIAGNTVALIDSLAAGGSNYTFQYNGWPTSAQCDPGNCPYLPGGAGVQCGTLYYTGPFVPAFGGRGARWSSCDFQFCCESPAGPNVIASQVIQLVDDLDRLSRAVIGQTFSLSSSAPGPFAGVRAALGLVAPTLVPGLGYSFLDPSTTVSLGPVASPGTVNVPIPLAMSLVGRTIAVQLIDQTNGYTDPVGAVIEWRPAERGPSHVGASSAPTGSATRNL